MPLNVLYNLINDKILNAAALPAGIKVSKEKNKDTNFFIFHLPNMKPAVIGGYTLLEHHVSVYEGSLSEVDKKSQYHYTALFQDNEKNKYRLHIYYDAKDHSLFRPQFCLQKLDKKYDAPMPVPLYEEAFNTLAYIEMAGLITFFRDEQRQALSKLKTKYDALEVEATALSKKIDEKIELIKSKAEYLAAIEAQLQIKKEQQRYDNDWRGLYAQIHALEKRGQNLLSLPAASAAAATATAASAVAATATAASAAAATATAASAAAATATAASAAATTATAAVEVARVEELTSKNDFKDSKESDSNVKTKQKEPSKIDISVELIKLNKRFSQYKQAPAAEQPAVLDACYADILTLEMATTHSNDLEQLKSAIEREGKLILESSLITGKHAVSNQMSSFYPLVRDNVFNLAIARSGTDLSLLTYLLEKKIIPLDYKNCAIKNVSYSSLVAYYFESDILLSNKIKALTLLLSHGVSLMALDKKGLPYVARLFWELNHPLQDILSVIPDLGLFYKQFNEVLNVVMSQTALNPASKAAVMQLIKDNNTRIAQIYSNSAIAKLTVLAPANRKDVLHKTGLAQQLMADLRRDPDIFRLQQEIHHKLKACVNRLRNPQRKNELAKVCQVDLNKFAEVLLVVDESTLPTLSSLKRVLLEQQRKVLSYIDLESLIPPNDINVRNKYKLKEYAELREKQLHLRVELCGPYIELINSALVTTNDLLDQKKLSLKKDEQKLRQLKAEQAAMQTQLAEAGARMRELKAKIAEAPSAAGSKDTASAPKETATGQKEVAKPAQGATPPVPTGAAQAGFFARTVQPDGAGTAVAHTPNGSI